MSTSPTTQSLVVSILNDDNVHFVEQVQVLWSGYGAITRWYSPKHQQTVILKYIEPNQDQAHPRGWNSEFAHQRKLLSYQNEQAFYQHYAKMCEQHCPVPAFIASNQSHALPNLSADVQFLLMQDLNAAGYAQRYQQGNVLLAKRCIHWLANFHATFLVNKAKKMWPIGSYWHLQTRMHEFEAMPESALKRHAQAIDNKLNSAQFQTLVHGDAKLANFCFHTNNSDIAAVDFQYAGCGIGVKDVAYFLGSCFDDDGLQKHCSNLFDEYFMHLRTALGTMASATEVACFSSIEVKWRELIPFAWADFERFLCGWSPSHHKLTSYSCEQTHKAILQCEDN